ncbi:DNA recombination protein RmuC [Leptothrix ochracea]|uniref:DNA recombination protein RmuC n=2 Tax=Leptothrix ochracea TaxID=735331 RepID=UPI00387E720D
MNESMLLAVLLLAVLAALGALAVGVLNLRAIQALGARVGDEAALDRLADALVGSWRTDADRLERELRSEIQLAARGNRQELAEALARFGTLQTEHLRGQGEATDRRLSEMRQMMEQRLGAVQLSVEQRLGQLQQSVEVRLRAMQADNETRLEQMRATVDEKLHATLEQRLGESFKHVAERLEQVHRGLGEMQGLAQGVGDLRRVLTNVKARGVLGEVQLGALLEQVFTHDQYAVNVATVPGSANRVEFALRLPGRGGDQDGPVWLPIDAKFPREDYERLIDAQERADREGAELSARALEQRIRDEARTIAAKYISPPHTTDFGLLFVPTEGLYAELLRRPGLVEDLQRQHRIMLAGPTTLLALLNSLQMGFRTLALEKRSAEVWTVLGAVKTEFSKFGDILEKTRKKLQEASNSIESAEIRTRSMARTLRRVEALPEAEAQALLPPTEPAAANANAT